MKALFKSVFTSLLSLFNVGIYCSDGVDSLLQQLHLLELENQANEILRLYALMEYQNQLILALDAFRTGLMFLSLLFLFILNFALFKRSYLWAIKKVQIAYSFITTKLKTKLRKWRM